MDVVERDVSPPAIRTSVFQEHEATIAVPSKHVNVLVRDHSCASHPSSISIGTPVDVSGKVEAAAVDPHVRLPVCVATVAASTHVCKSIQHHQFGQKVKY